MKSRIAGDDIVGMEDMVLSALCQGAARGALRDVARRSLRRYRWHDPGHEAIFQALMAIPSESAEAIRAQLPSRLTRMGFPDLSWEALFVPLPGTRVDLQKLIEELLKTAASGK